MSTQSKELSVRPGIDAFSTADALEQLVSVERPFAVNEPASKCLGCIGCIEPPSIPGCTVLSRI